MGKKQGKSECKVPSQELNNNIMPPGSDKPKVCEWEQYKNRGNVEFGKQRFSEACEHYTAAIEKFNKANIVKDMTDLAKLYGNRSASYLHLSDATKNLNLLKNALKDAQKAIAVDTSYYKGHFRCIQVLLKIGNKKEAVEHLSAILKLRESNQEELKKDEALMKCLAECRYSSATKEQSCNWIKVKFKDNCVVVDIDGTGDYTSVAECLQAVNKRAVKKVSVLVKPGTYLFVTSILITDGMEVDIIGDDPKQDPAKVVFENKENLLDRNPCHLFCVNSNSKVFLDGVSIRQCSLHAERHGLFVSGKSKAYVTNCLGYARSSGLIAVIEGSRLLMSKTQIKDACAGVIVTSSSYAIIEGCTITDAARIGVEVRETGYVVLVDCEISKCGSQGLVGHADALGYAVRRCIFYGNCRKLPDQGNVFVAAGVGVIDDCQITCTGDKGSCVMVQRRARCEISNSRLAGGACGIGFTLRGSGHVCNCQIANVRFGLSIVCNERAEIILEKNKISSQLADISVHSDDIAPTMLDVQHKVQRLCVPCISKQMLKHRLDMVDCCDNDDDYESDDETWRDPRETLAYDWRTCFVCGLSPQRGGARYFKCSACKMTWYCSKECQKKDWPTHKAMCSKVRDACKSV